MNRRSILAGAAAAVAGLTLTRGLSYAQQSGRVYRVGVLFNIGIVVNGKPNPQFETLRMGLTQLGYVEGTNIIYEPCSPEGRLERLPGFAADLVAKSVDVIVAYGGPSTSAARRATTTIPIVANLVADPVAIEVAATLERPGGNTTGVTNDDPELAARQLAILTQLFPKLTRVAFLSDSDIPGSDATGLAPIERANMVAARTAGLTPKMVKVRGPKPDLEAAFQAMLAERAEALVVLEVPAPILARNRVAELAAAHRMPSVFWGGKRGADAGGLISYGTGSTATYPRMAVIVDKVLKGAKPEDKAFEVVSKRELVINLKTARELGMTIPAELLKRADRVVE